jgi:hypothetical protein
VVDRSKYWKLGHDPLESLQQLECCCTAVAGRTKFQAPLISNGENRVCIGIQHQENEAIGGSNLEVENLNPIAFAFPMANTVSL